MKTITTSRGVEALQALHKTILQCKGQDPFAPVTVCAPSSYTGLHIRKRLASASGSKGGLLNVRFMPLARVAELIGAERLTSEGYLPASKAVKLELVRVALHNDPGVFSDAINHPAMAEQLMHVFERLRETDEAAVEKLSTVNQRTRDTVRLLHDYNTLLAEHHLYDRKIAFATAAECIRNDSANLQDFGTIVVHLAEPVPAAGPMLDALDEKGALLLLLAQDDYNSEVPLVSKMAVAPNREEEVRYIIRQIMERLSANVPLYRMGIALRSPAPYCRMLNDLLTTAEIPHNGNPAAALKESLGARALLDALAVAQSSFGKTEVMHLVSDVPLKLPAASNSSGWPRIIRQALVGSGMDGWRKGLGSYISLKGEQAARLDDENAAWYTRQAEEAGQLLAWLEAVYPLLDIPEEASWSKYSDCCLGLLAGILDSGQLTESDLAALGQVCQTLESLKSLEMLSASTTMDAFIAALISELESQKPVGLAGKHGEGVFIGSFDNVAAMDLDLVFIPGMAEGVVPAQAPTSAIITEGDCEAVGGGFALTDISAESERTLFLSVVQSASEVVIIYPQSDERAARPLSPSRLLLEQASCLSGKDVYSSDLSSLGEPWVSHLISPYNALMSLPPGSLQDYRTKSLISHLASGGNEQTHYLYSNGLLKNGIDCLKARTSFDYTRFDGMPGEVYQPDWSVALSPTRLENFAKCPYSHFLKKVLEVEGIEDEPDTLWMDAAVKGLLYHTVFQRLISQLIGTRFRREIALETVRSIAAEEFEKLEAESLTGNPALWELEKQSILCDFERFVDEEILWQAAGYRPIAVEKAFGNPPFEVTLPDGRSIRFHGRIDRVDINESSGQVAVIDYKTSRKYNKNELAADCTLAGNLLQHYIYGLFASQETKAPHAVGIYRMVSQKGEYETQIIPVDEVNAQRCQTVVSAIVETIEKGIFPANPGSGGRYSHCAYCEYRQLCVPDRMRLWRRKQSSDLLKGYTSLSAGREATNDDAE